MIMRRCLLLGAVVASVSMGCQQPSNEAPKGYEGVTTDSVSFIHPSDWKKQPADELEDGVEATVRLHEGKDVVATVAVLDQGKASNASLTIAKGRAGPQISWPGYHVVDQDKIKVNGAESAKRARYTYRAETGQGEGDGTGKVLAHGRDVGFVDDQRNATIVRLTWLDGALEKSTVRRIVKSVDADV